MQQLTLVCKGWVEAATNILYRSVSLADSPSATSFLDALDTSPFLATKVSRIVVKLADDSRPPSQPHLQLLAESRILLQALERCKATITHLHVFPLPDQTRPRLFAIISNMPALQTLVCSARFHQPTNPLGVSEEEEDGVPTSGIEESVTLNLPRSLHTLELDFESSWSVETRPFFHGPSLRGLRKIRLRTETDEDVLWEILRECTRLEVCELYLEQLPSIHKAQAALLSSVSTMKNLVFISNPTIDNLTPYNPSTQQTFDRLLPLYTHLETLSLSSTEISSSVFRLLPPSLMDLEIHSFNYASPFTFMPQLTSDLRDRSLAVGLRNLRLQGFRDAFSTVQAEELEVVCAERGVECFISVESDGGST